jgi:AraC-like DNA-binding protein
MNLKNYKSTAFLVLTITLISTIGAFLLREQRLSFFPLTENIKVTSYADIEDGGSSTAKASKKEGAVFLDYSLGNKFEDPYVGLVFYNTPKQNFIDLSSYESISIKVHSIKSKRIRINLRTFCDKQKEGDFTSDFKKPNSLLTLEYEMDYSPDKEEYLIPIANFYTPTWWFKDNNLENGNNSHCTLENFTSIEIENSNFTKAGEADTITVYELSALKYNYVWLYILLCGSLLAIVLLVVSYTQKKKTVFVPYQTTPEIASGNDALENKIFDYIANHYANPDLSLSTINADTGIAENKISTIIKVKYNQSFKQYINNIRMTEAKRLLKESEGTISEIAYSVGYNNVTHFNRVFKTETGVAPGDFRKGENSGADSTK